MQSLTGQIATTEQLMTAQLEALHQINYIRIYTVFNNTLYSFYNLGDS